MQSRVSYAAVGLFVLLLGAVFVGLGLWLGADVSTTPISRYSVYFQESVSGLNRNAPVKYRGVVVGSVETIELAPDDPEQVHLVIAVAARTPIKVDTRAKLDPQGVTGILHLELTDGTRESPRLLAEPGKPYPVIESIPSLITRLDQAVTAGLVTMDKLGAQLSQLLSEGNQASLSRTLENLERFSGALAANSGRLESTLSQADRLLANGADAAEQMPALISDIRQTLDRFDTLSVGIKEAGDKVSAMAGSGQRQLEALGGTVPEADRLLGDLRRLVDSLTRLSDELRANPRMLIFGRPEPVPGPGE